MQSDIADQDGGRRVEELERELREARQQKTATSEILRVISISPTDAQPVFDAVVASAVRLLRGNASSLTRIEGNQMALAAMTSTDAAGNAAQRARFPLPLDSEEDHAQVTRTRAPLNISDAHADPRLPEAQQASARIRGYRSLVVVPLLRHDEVVGSLGVSRRESGGFTDDEIAVLQTFADQAVIAIENTRLFNETKEALARQTATAEILEVIASSPSDVQPVLEAVAERAMSLLDAWSVIVTGFDGEMLHFGAARGALPDTEQFLRQYYPARPSPENNHGRCILERIAINCPDAQADLRPQMRDRARTRGFRASLSVPMVRDGQPIGAISVSRKEAGAFSANEVALLQTFADQAVIAIENTRLFEAEQVSKRELQESLDRQTATSEVLGVISRSPSSVEPVLHAIVTTARRLCEAERAIVWRLEGETLRAVAHDGQPEERVESVLSQQRPLSRESIVGRAVIARRVVQVADVTSDTELVGVRAFNQTGNIRTVLAVPLLLKGEPIGVITLARTRVAPFAAKQVALIKSFGDQAVIAIENTRLFEEVQARTGELTEALEYQTATGEVLGVISRSPTDAKPVFESIAKSAAQLCWAQHCNVYRFDGQLLYIAATYLAPGMPPGAREANMRQPPIAPGRGNAAARSIAYGTIAEIPDIDADPDYERRDVTSISNLRSTMAVPMLRDGRPIGAIVVSRSERGRFSDRQIKLLETFADQAVIAIENARLFEAEQASKRELQESLKYQTATSEVLGVISRSKFDLQPIIDTIVETATNLCQARRGALMRFEEGGFRLLPTTGGMAGPVTKGLVDRLIPIDRGSIAGRVALERRTVHVLDLQVDPEFTLMRGAEGDDRRTCLGVPLIASTGLLGAMVLQRTHVEPFTQKQIDLVETFADQAVIAFENTRLFEEITHKSRELEIASQHKSQFVANMSHELRTPLAAILGYAELMQEGFYEPLGKKSLDALTRIRSNGKHLLGLINTVLDIAKIESGQFSLNLGEYAIDNVVETVRAATESLAEAKKLALWANVAKKLPVGLGDEQRLTQVLLNLVGNAIKFTDTGEVRITATAMNGHFTVAVTDTGPGIPPGELNRVFDQFHQVDSSNTKAKGGTGLGLAIAKQIVEMHGGRIWVESTLGQGATFQMQLPIRAEFRKATP